LIPYIALAMAIMVGTAIAKRTSDLGWLVMAGPLLLALISVGADVLAFRLQREKRGPATPTLLLMMGFLAGCGILALGDPAPSRNDDSHPRCVRRFDDSGALFRQT
jgi:hypothetical protein